jgi:arsenite methyltransferase
VCFGEIYRILNPGGSLAVSDTLAKKPFPVELQRNMGLYVGCISGASLVCEYETWLEDSGFEGMFVCWIQKSLGCKIAETE